MKILSKITTPVQQFEKLFENGVSLGKVNNPGYFITSYSDLPIARTAEKHISDKLFKLFETKEQGSSTEIVLDITEAPAGVLNADQGYRITVANGKILLEGFGERGLLYAAVTLCQMFETENGELYLPAFTLTDWPGISKRGHFIESRFGTDLLTFDDWKEIVDDLLEKKQNTMTVSLYGCWSIQFDGVVSEYLYVPFAKYPKLQTPVYTKYYSPEKCEWVDKEQLPPMYEEDFFGELCAYAKERGIEVIPMINTYGHNTLIPRMYPEVSAKFSDGTPTMNGLCTSETATDDMLFYMLDTIIEKYLRPLGLKSFHIGLDEVGDADYTVGVYPDDPFLNRPAFCECEKCRDKTAIERFIAHAVKLISYLKKQGMTSVYMYVDMLFRAYRPKEKDFMPAFIAAVKEAGVDDVTVIDWWKYNCDKSLFDYLAFSADDIRRSGLRAVVKPMNGYYHWHLLHPAIKNSHNHAAVANECKCEGYMSYSGWDKMYDHTNSAQASMSWCFEKSATTQECIRAYCDRVFSAASEKAQRGFCLLDMINEEKSGEDLNTRKLFESILSYYPYSYLRAGKPYLRNFPGEAISTIHGNREEIETMIKTCRAWATEAVDIFAELYEIPGCDKAYARLYALEANNYLMLCDDYLALLKMYDLTKEEEPNAEMIESIAKVRKNARLAHMETLEKIKKPYLLASQMRHQSIFMQLFADIEENARKKLDFTDLSNIASERYIKIR